MAVLKYRLRRKNTSGTYDVLHLETQASEVLRYGAGGVDNGTVESALVALESGKADLVDSATNGNFAGLDANGNLTDSGSKAADFAAASHTHDLSELETSTLQSKVLVTDASGNVAGSDTTPTELGYVHGVTSGIQGQLDNKLETSLKGANNGLAELDSAGKVPSSQLPSYVDDVLEYANYAALPAEGETGKIYVTLDDNKTYRWGGSAYVEISESLALGNTSSTAYRGDYGEIAYNHSQADAPHVPTAADTGKILKSVAGNQAVWGNETDLSKGTTSGSGNVVTDISVSGHEITLTKGSTAVLEGDARLTDARTPLSHTHGNITNDGKLQTSDATIGNGDKLVITDASDGNAVARASLEFDGSTTSQALTKAGTFESFLQAADAVSTVTYDTTNKKLTKTINGTTTDVVTTAALEADMDEFAGSSKGLVPAAAAGDAGKYLKADGSWDTPYTHPTYTAAASGFYKVTVDGTGHVSGTTAVAATDITALGFVEASFAATQPTGQQTNGLWFETIS